MTLSRTAAAAAFLCAVIFFWRFQIGVGSAGMPLYAALMPVLLLLDIPREVLIRTLIVGAVAVGGILIAMLQGVPPGRPAVSMAALLIMMGSFVAAGASIRQSSLDGWQTFARLIRIIIRLQIALQLLEIAGLPILDNRAYPHYYLPFDRVPGLLIEPSHVAITFSPLLVASLWPRMRSFGGHIGRWDYALVYLAVFLCPSATLLVVLALALALRVGARSPFLGMALIALPLLVSQNLGAVLSILPDAISDRVSTLIFILSTGYFDQQSNFSSVVFYGGFRAAMTTLAEYPLGVGFLNMGAAYQFDGMLHYLRIAGESNVNDGSSMLFKLATEFGWLGVALALYAVFALWHYFATERGDLTPGILAFPLMAFFARGASYLDGPVLISLVVILFGLRQVPAARPRQAWGGT